MAALASSRSVWVPEWWSLAPASGRSEQVQEPTWVATWDVSLALVAPAPAPASGLSEQVPVTALV